MVEVAVLLAVASVAFPISAEVLHPAAGAAAGVPVGPGGLPGAAARAAACAPAAVAQAALPGRAALPASAVPAGLDAARRAVHPDARCDRDAQDDRDAQGDRGE